MISDLLFAQLEWCGTKVTYKTAMVGAINHIGPEINHCVEDIFCHCCPLTITLHKTLTPTTHTSGLTSLFFFQHPIGHKISYRLVPQRMGEESPFNQPFSIKVKVFRVVYMRDIKKYSWGGLAKRSTFFIYFLFDRDMMASFHGVHPIVPPLW